MPTAPLHIGVDFDNTIVCYDALFHRVARERNLIPADLPVNKSDVRNHLRRAGNEEAWTEMQGAVYGGRMSEAAAYPGVIEFFESCRRAAITLSIISHKTRHPFLGPRYDLHQAAMLWLEEQGFFDPPKIGLPRGNAFFELTREAKLERILQCGCTHFIDDLPEVFAEPQFPKIGRILFDPGGIYGGPADYFRAQTWPQIWQMIAGQAAVADPLGRAPVRHSFSDGGRLQPSEGTPPAPALRDFVRQQGFSSATKILPLAGGGNNRVYRVQDDRRDAVLKHYFRHAADLRDRFGAERAFYTFLWYQGIRRTPEPLAWNVEHRLGLLSFIQGRKLAASEVDQAAVRQALDFVLEINRARSQAQAAAIPAGSEACFSAGEHLECIAKRVQRLDQIVVDTEIDRHAQDLVHTALRPAWEQVKAAITRSTDLMRPLPLEQRLLSPSDFGFHNALRASDGRLQFIDFEYAGWDDPAKLICDFFCQPQLPVAVDFWEQFVVGLTQGLDLDKALPDRALLLLPAYRIKWCCIMLNDFVRADSARRDFAKGTASVLDRKTAQLAGVRRALSQVVPAVEK